MVKEKEDLLTEMERGIVVNTITAVLVYNNCMRL